MSKRESIKRPAWITREPDAWFEAGNDLIAGARLLWNEKVNPLLPRRRDRGPEFWRPFFLMAGFGLEGNLKGLRVRQMIRAGVPRIDPKGSLVNSLATHDLMKLADAAKVSVSVSHSQRRIVQKLTMYTTWAGRYPIPRHSPRSGAEYVVISSEWSDIEAILGYIDDADTELRTERIDESSSVIWGGDSRTSRRKRD